MESNEQNFKTVARIVADLKSLRFCPDDDGVFAIVKMFCTMAQTLDQVEWTVARCLALHSVWPGPREIRAVFCSRWKPLDRIEVSSEVYAEGIPSASESVTPGWSMQIPAGATREPLQLEGPALELAQSLVKAGLMGVPVQRLVKVDPLKPEERARLETEFEKAEQEYLERKAKAEAGL